VQQLEESCGEIADLTVLVRHATVFLIGLNKEHTFFLSALKCPVVYLSSGLLFPASSELQAAIDACIDS
jgi:hypothetical protein